jgi:RHS repeat-associated protein
MTVLRSRSMKLRRLCIKTAEPGGSAGQTNHIYAGFTNNRRNGFSYDAAGNLTNDLGQTFTYDATGQQATASYMSVQQSYDGDGLRVKKIENGTTRYYLRSTVLGGQVVAEMDTSGTWMRGYVYQGGSLLAVQAGGVNWVHEDPVTKSKRVTDSLGNIVSSVELDPWGGDTNRSSNAAFQPKKFTSYHRDDNGSDEAMFRRYNRWHSRFDQPDPYDGSYDLTDPQSFNRYAYVGNDPVNFVDPTGLEPNTCLLEGTPINCGTASMFIHSGAGVYGPLDTSQYDYSKGTFVHFTAVATSGGAASGFIPQGAHYLGGLTWGWTDYSKDDAPSWSYSLKSTESWFWLSGQWELHMWGYRYDAYGNKLGVQPQGVEIDWDAQLAIGGGLNGLRAGLQALIDSLVGQFARKSAVQSTLKNVVEWMGPGTRSITNKAGDKIFLSEDGLRRIRFDFIRPNPHVNPHIHVEEFVNGAWRGSRIWPKGILPK